MKKVAIAGFGVVGGGVAEILCRNADLIEQKTGQRLELGYIVDLREFPDSPYADKLTKDFGAVESDPEVFVVVEAIGGCGAALNFCTRALKAGKSVVTSNKQLVAEHGLELVALAKEHGVNFLFEASVGGGIPLLHPLNRCLAANTITEVTGILNGTTNYILTQMLENGADYGDALKQAQKLGYAEADPTADVEGIDAGRKTCILADLAFGRNVSPKNVSMEGISKITALDAAFAESAGMKIKLLGRAVMQDGREYAFVSPHFVKNSVLLANVGDVFNAAVIKGSEVGEVLFYGPGAGRFPTASAVVGDVIDIAANPGRPQPACWSAEEAELADPETFRASFFFRTSEAKADAEAKLGNVTWLPDQDGVHGGITGVMTKKEILASGFSPDACWPVYGG